jgi:sugar (pentulose or hexulose) kinase
MRTHLHAALGALKVGMNILLEDEGVEVDQILGHGGLFKTKGVGQPIMAAAMNVPVAVMETAGEGGAWGIAVLAAFAVNKAEGESFPDYLDQKIFASQKMTTLEPDKAIVDSFNAFMERYTKGLAIERAAVEM